jgi:hypothetical protein
MSSLPGGWPFRTDTKILRHICKAAFQLRVERTADRFDVECTGKPDLQHVEEGIFCGRKGRSTQNFDEIPEVVTTKPL